MNGLKAVAVGALSAALPQRLKRLLLHLSYHLAPSEFERFAHTWCAAPSMAVGLEQLAARGFSPKTIVDVGAFEGGWTETSHRIWPGSRPIMIEPNKAKLAKLKSLAHSLDGETHCALLGSSAGDSVPFYVMETGSSVMRENSTVRPTIETRTVETLDSLALNLEGVNNFLKIDVQGYELEVLRGAANSLHAFEAVLLEVAIIEINEGAPLLHDVTTFMTERGFVVIDVLEIHRRPLDRATSQIDLVFVRTDSELLADRRYDA
jgi:FkbM family methyltransferase